MELPLWHPSTTAHTTLAPTPDRSPYYLTDGTFCRITDYTAPFMLLFAVVSIMTLTSWGCQSSLSSYQLYTTITFHPTLAT